MADGTRFGRQEALRLVGKDGQERLARSTVAVVGCGGLGTHAAESLVRSGVGKTIVIDKDAVERSNLHRVSLFTEADVGRPKALVAAERLKAIDRDVRVIAVAQELGEETVGELAPADLIMDCTDNLATRYLIDRWCREKRKPWVHAACVEQTGEVLCVLPDGPSLSDLKRDGAPERSPEMDGVLGTIPAMTAALAATQGIRILLDGEPERRLIRIDAWAPSIRRYEVRR
ncbi:HesA/MoeB/ThiF family protein [Candidatus Woesearchaeota archaeon]|nr:HesA/MoeB/ThiF family protein [Candidatus Woesearchaeota archaeon]